MSRLACPHCGHKENRAREYMPTEDAHRRQRQCLGCDKRFWTEERIIPLNEPQPSLHKYRKQFAKKKPTVSTYTAIHNALFKGEDR